MKPKNKILILSHVINNNTPLYGGVNNISIKPMSNIKNGDTANSLMVKFPNHVGTHIDVPYHFFEHGKKLTDYDPSFWVFNNPTCIDVACSEDYLIKFDDIKNHISIDNDLILIRTGFEKFRAKKIFWNNNPGISEKLAHNLRARFPKIRALGIDTISITARQHRAEGKKAHRKFLSDTFPGSPIVLIEDMKLSIYKGDIGNIIIAPLMLEESDGAPCSVLAFLQ